MTELAKQQVLRAEPGQARATRTVEHILDAALELLVECGPDAVTTRAVAERAGTAVGTVYRYFSDSGQILVAAHLRLQSSVSARWFERFGQLVDASPTEAATALFDAYAAEAQAEPALVPLLRALQGLAAPYRSLAAESDDLIDLFAQRLGIRRGATHQTRIRLLKHLTLTLMDSWLLGNRNERNVIRTETLALTASMLERMR
jgi:AcrR family transcriptional regulator